MIWVVILVSGGSWFALVSPRTYTYGRTCRETRDPRVEYWDLNLESVSLDSMHVPVVRVQVHPDMRGPKKSRRASAQAMHARNSLRRRLH